MSIFNLKNGMVSILMVSLVSLIGILVVTAWQTRMLLSIQRMQSMGDILRATYNAESEINDLIAKYLGEFPMPGSGQKTLADGTILTVAHSMDGSTEVYDVNAKRQYATTNIQMRKTDNISESTAYDQVEIVLQLDCTGSMKERADENCRGPDCATRLTKAKEALLGFLDSVLALPESERSKYLVGLEVYRIGQKWLRGVFSPSDDLQALRDAVEAGFGTTPNTSPGCDVVNPVNALAETNLGGAMIFSDEYLKENEAARKKQISILITDGLPNNSYNSTNCGVSSCSGNLPNSCMEESLDLLTCGLADTLSEWNTGVYGKRGEEVDDYAVSVMYEPSETARDYVLYIRTQEIFNDNDLVKRFYNSEDANNLPQILQDIFNEIVEGTSTLNIRRVIPTPG